MGQKLDTARNLYIKGIQEGHYREAVEEYTGATYIQHSTKVRDGKDGFIEFFESFVANNPHREFDLMRGLEDGDYAFVQAHQRLDHGNSQWLTMDFFRFDAEDRILEHWDTINRYHGHTTPQGHTRIDGPSEADPSGDPTSNKAAVHALIRHAFTPEGDSQQISQYLSFDDLVHHDPDVDDPRAFFAESDLHYTEVVLTVGDGDMVATLSRVRHLGEAGQPEYATADLFRLAGGKVVEHWSNGEPVPPRDEWVNSGKF